MFSQRWKSMDLVDIKDWASDEIRTIQISQTFVDARYEVKVRKFIPLQGDMLAQRWKKEGRIVTFDIPPYGLANMKEASKSLSTMVERNIAAYIQKTVGNDGSHPILWGTYLMAFKRIQTAPVSITYVSCDIILLIDSNGCKDR